MKNRLIALCLLLATMFGLFSCAAVKKTEEGETPAQEPANFIRAEKSLLGDTQESPVRPEKLFNLAAVDENGDALFHIVHPARTSQTVEDEAKRLAEDIYETTGVSLAVVDHYGGKRDYEIVLQTGLEITRPEILPVTDEYNSRLKDHDFLIKVCETRLVLYGKTEQSIKSAVLFLMGAVSYKNEESGEYGVSADISFSYQPVDHPKAEFLGKDKNYFEFALVNSEQDGMELNTYARLSFTGNSGWRLQTKYEKDAEYNDFGAAQRLSYSLGESEPSALEEISVTGPVGGIYLLTASDESYVTVNIGEGNFRMDFYTPSGKLASSVTNISTNAAGSIIAGVLEKDEAIYGTGERFNKSNQRGQYIDMFSRDVWSSSLACYMVIPLLCSSRGSGIFVNLYEPMTMDLGRENKNEWKTVTLGTALDVYFFTTDQISDVIYSYSLLTGFAGMPEEWTYGMIVCAYSPDLKKKWTVEISPSEDGRGEGVYEAIANMEKYDLPWTGVMLEAWNYRTGSEEHADLKELCDYVHSLGKKLMVYMGVAAVRPYMVADGRLSTHNMGVFLNDYYLYQKKPNGSGYNIPETGSAGNNPDNTGGDRLYLDITNPDAVRWFFEEYWAYLKMDIGVDGCKIDFCEQIPENYKLLYFDETMPTAGSHHWFPSAFCAMYWDMISEKPDSGMCYTRGGGIGAQRAPYMWAGDQTRSYNSLSWQLTAVLSSGFSGVPYMSYDMAGYKYDSAMSLEAEGHVFIRGTQFTAFTVCMQTHGTVKRAYQFANENPDYLFVTELYRAYVKLHEHLTPYITELCVEASTTGMPVMRHLILGWQDDKTVYNIENEYTFGDAFLIAPILNAGYTRDIYLPEGEWLDLNTGDEYSVGKSGLWLRDYGASLAELPTFYNKNTVSKVAPTLTDGISALYDYARSVMP